MTKLVIPGYGLRENVRYLIRTLYRKNIIFSISHEVLEVAIDLIGVLGVRSHFRIACQLQSTVVFFKRSTVDLW